VRGKISSFNILPASFHVLRLLAKTLKFRLERHDFAAMTASFAFEPMVLISGSFPAPKIQRAPDRSFAFAQSANCVK